MYLGNMLLQKPNKFINVYLNVNNQRTSIVQIF